MISTGRVDETLNQTCLEKMASIQLASQKTRQAKPVPVAEKPLSRRIILAVASITAVVARYWNKNQSND